MTFLCDSGEQGCSHPGRTPQAFGRSVFWGGSRSAGSTLLVPAPLRYPGTAARRGAYSSASTWNRCRSRWIPGESKSPTLARSMTPE